MFETPHSVCLMRVISPLFPWTLHPPPSLISLYGPYYFVVLRQALPESSSSPWSFATMSSSRFDNDPKGSARGQLIRSTGSFIAREEKEEEVVFSSLEEREKETQWKLSAHSDQIRNKFSIFSSRFGLNNFGNRFRVDFENLYLVLNRSQLTRFSSNLIILSSSSWTVFTSTPSFITLPYSHLPIFFFFLLSASLHPFQLDSFSPLSSFSIFSRLQLANLSGIPLTATILSIHHRLTF